MAATLYNDVQILSKFTEISSLLSTCNAAAVLKRTLEQTLLPISKYYKKKGKEKA